MTYRIHSSYLTLCHVIVLLGCIQIILHSLGIILRFICFICYFIGFFSTYAQITITILTTTCILSCSGSSSLLRCISILHHHLQGINKAQFVGCAALKLSHAIIGKGYGERIMILEIERYASYNTRQIHEFHNATCRNVSDVRLIAIGNVVHYHYLKHCARLAVQVKTLLLACCKIHR